MLKPMITLSQYLSVCFPGLPQSFLDRVSLENRVGLGVLAIGMVEFAEGRRYTTQLKHPELGRFADSDLPDLHGYLDSLTAEADNHPGLYIVTRSDRGNVFTYVPYEP